MVNTERAKKKEDDDLKDEKVHVKYLNLHTVMNQLLHTGVSALTNRWSRNSSFPNMKVEDKIDTILMNIKGLGNPSVTLSYDKQREKLAASVSLIESMTIMFSQIVALLEKERFPWKGKMEDLLNGTAIPLLTGTMMMEFQMLWTHLAEV